MNTPETDALECAFALLKCSPIGDPKNSYEYGRAAYILSEHCQGKEDVSEAAMRIFAKRIADLERERDEAREDLDEETKFHHRTHSELVQTQCKLMDVTQAIIATLEENRHLADGDDCTLAKLKSVVPDWK